jgi:hypothetical protein
LFSSVACDTTRNFLFSGVACDTTDPSHATGLNKGGATS